MKHPLGVCNPRDFNHLLVCDWHVCDASRTSQVKPVSKPPPCRSISKQKCPFFVFMCRADLGDPDMQYRILHSASKRLQQGGPKRICVTTPPLVISATLLAQQYYQMKDQARIIR